MLKNATIVGGQMLDYRYLEVLTRIHRQVKRLADAADAFNELYEKSMEPGPEER